MPPASGETCSVVAGSQQRVRADFLVKGLGQVLSDMSVKIKQSKRVGQVEMMESGIPATHQGHQASL
jgi:hypothetical protein